MPIIVKPISAQLVHDTDTFSNMDPYIICMVGHQKHRSQTHQGGGRQPSWTDTFQINTCDSLMRVQVFDSDVVNDDLIGEGTVNLNQLYANPYRTQNQYVDLIYHGKSAGRVLLSLQFQGQANSGQFVQPQNFQGQGSGWGQGPNQGWGGQGPNQGWGGQGSGWGQGQNQGWQNPNQGWGQGPNQGFSQNPNQGWGQGPNQGWGNNNGW